MTLKTAELDATSIEVLSDIFDLSLGGRSSIDRKMFRAKYYTRLDLMDALEKTGYLLVNDSDYILPITSFLDISAFNLKVDEVLQLCGYIYSTLGREYRQHPGKNMELSEFSRSVDMPAHDVSLAISLISDLQLFDNLSRNKEGIVTNFTISEKVLRVGKFRETLENHKKLRLETAVTTSPTSDTEILNTPSILKTNYVDPKRMLELESIESDKFDLSKVVRICEELNSCIKDQSFLAIAGLIRMLLDHVPPIFDCRSFKEVANASTGRSQKKSLLHLENSSRNISDYILHQHIRRQESLPVEVTINYSNDIDILLGEIIRAMKSSSTSEN